jgi:hypothetical protein
MLMDAWKKISQLLATTEILVPLKLAIQTLDALAHKNLAMMVDNVQSIHATPQLDNASTPNKLALLV